MRETRRAALVIVVVLAGTAALADEPERTLGFGGSCDPGEAVPAPWRHVSFPSIPRATEYSLVQSGTTIALRAVAASSASVVIRRVPEVLDTARTPLLRWRWSVTRTIVNGTGAGKQLDDFAARVWVGFETDWDHAGFFERREAAKLAER